VRAVNRAIRRAASGAARHAAGVLNSSTHFRRTMNNTVRIVTVALATAVGVAGLKVIATAQGGEDAPAAHVLLLSVDGLHGFDIVFELVKAAGGRTAWSDKHPSYEFLNGPSGTGVDDLYTPEITLNPPAVTTTNSFSLTMAYDDMKVAAIVNEINGLDHTGTTWVGTPALFGMNFQAVSVGQKLIENLPTGEVLVGGYLDAAGTPSGPLQAALDHTDQSI